MKYYKEFLKSKCLFKDDAEERLYVERVKQHYQKMNELDTEKKRIISEIEQELERLVNKYPVWPKDIIHSVSIVNEKSLEAMLAGIDYIYHGKPKEAIRTELIQTAAVSIKALMNL